VITPPSITSTDSFRFRAQRSEQRRIGIMIGVLAVLLLLIVMRRLFHGEVMSVNRVFYPTSVIIASMMVYEAIVLRNVRRANRESRLLPNWRWAANAVVEIAAPLGTLLILHLASLEGEVTALSAPGLLVLSIIITLSILRLRPNFTLWTGLAAGAAHAALVTHAIITLKPSPHLYSVLYAYSALLMLGGVAASLVAGEVKRYVREAVDEATAAEVVRQRVGLMERDLSIARDIQRGLLPTVPPVIKGFDIAGFSRPADETGGDYYDWQTLPDGRVAVVLADVTGHGIGPALVMAVCRAYARASAPIVPEPAALLHRLNNLIHADIGQGRFITLVVAILDGTASKLEMLSAGHGPILLFKAADKSIVRYNGDGFPLGIVPDGEFGQSHSVAMASGDVLLMITDGFFEWQRPSDRQAFGIERIEQLLIQHADEYSETLLKKIDDAVCAFCQGAVQNDDMTAVVVKCR
jgi:serine phosphatase RsbU (regulator of sigma subunit)